MLGCLLPTCCHGNIELILSRDQDQVLSYSAVIQPPCAVDVVVHVIGFQSLSLGNKKVPFNSIKFSEHFMILKQLLWHVFFKHPLQKILLEYTNLMMYFNDKQMNQETQCTIKLHVHVFSL